ncbi:hypothetical protein DY000_02049767 [Brassica cretica]|uniref:Uncharacterized protein n=1 Tax=Brassica cretica TaxID=69181 RepID=A0ABQ7EZ40_BRACR|nr:hypothetical protein DY000_02049767 [Brassica cretica]
MTCLDDLLVSLPDDLLMMRQLHAVYGEWLLNDCRWDFVVDNVKGARIIFLGEGSTHAELLAMAQEDYNLDMSTESVEITYSLPAEMMQAPDTPPIHVTSDRQVRNLLEITKTHGMMRQLHAVYGEWLLNDCRWDFVVDNVKGARIIFLGEGSTHAELLAMAQEDYNLDMSTESVEITYSLPAEMMQAPDTPPIHVTSDRQVRNLLEITKTHGVRLCVSSRSKVETVSEFREDDEADECFEDDDDDLVEDENHDGEEDDGDEDDGEEDAGISIVAEADENGEDYSVYGKMMRQLHAVYGEWLLNDCRWDFVVDNVKGARIIFLGEGSTHAELLAMAQEDYNLDMSTESVEITYSLPAEMMQAPDTPPIHVTSDRQVRNLLEITKTHGVRLCVSSRSKVETVSEFREDDEADECFEDDDDDLTDVKHDLTLNESYPSARRCIQNYIKLINPPFCLCSKMAKKTQWRLLSPMSRPSVLRSLLSHPQKLGWFITKEKLKKVMK